MRHVLCDLEDVLITQNRLLKTLLAFSRVEARGFWRRDCHPGIRARIAELRRLLLNAETRRRQAEARALGAGLAGTRLLPEAALVLARCRKLHARVDAMARELAEVQTGIAEGLRLEALGGSVN